MTSLELVHGVTHLPLKLICPFEQDGPVNDGGQGTPSGLSEVLTGGCACHPVFWQMQTYWPAPDVDASVEPVGHSHMKKLQAGSLTMLDHPA